MKKLIIALFLLPIFATAQTYQSMPQAGYGPVKRMLFDSVLTLPLNILKLQNATGGRDIGQIRYNVSDSSIYIYSGSRWIKSGIDTSTIYYNLGLKLNISDTAQMMTAAPRVNRFLDSIANLKSSIALKLNISDTASMLSPYTRGTETALKLNISDTANMLAPYTRLTANALKLNISDTAAMLLTYARVQRLIDSVTNLKSSIALKVNISDTAAMMAAAPRVQRFLDSVTNLKTSIATKQNTLTLTTTGTSGAATLTGATLNIPQYLSTNIGNSDLTLTGNRTLSSGGYTLTILPKTTFNQTLTASASLAVGTIFKPTLTSTANTDYLSGVDIEPIFTVGSFASTETYGLRVNASSLFGTKTAIVSRAYLNPTIQVAANIGQPFSAVFSNTAKTNYINFEHNANNNLIYADGNPTVYPLILGTYTYKTNQLYLNTTGNILMGKTNDDGNKLQVSGSIISTQYKLSALNTAPASATATGVLGEIRYDANYMYVCVATNTWKRSALTTW